MCNASPDPRVLVELRSALRCARYPQALTGGPGRRARDAEKESGPTGLYEPPLYQIPALVVGVALCVKRSLQNPM